MLPEQNTIYCMIPQGCRGPDSAGWPSAVKTRQSCRQRQDHQPAILSCLHCRWQVSCSIVAMAIVISCIWRVSCSCAVPAIPARLSMSASAVGCRPSSACRAPHLQTKGKSHTDQRAGLTQIKGQVLCDATGNCSMSWRMLKFSLSSRLGSMQASLRRPPETCTLRCTSLKTVSAPPKPASLPLDSCSRICQRQMSVNKKLNRHWMVT